MKRFLLKSNAIVFIYIFLFFVLILLMIHALSQYDAYQVRKLGIETVIKFDGCYAQSNGTLVPCMNVLKEHEGENRD
ncbi:hypothetical protein ACO0K3_03920 [Undibacterium sp. Rencai35W]|uniref:hypothetical protein n=1 Tax=Undibacterium sp. Rencai35W TaxID=3413046 RepID=UPI003BF19A0F